VLVPQFADDGRALFAGQDGEPVAIEAVGTKLWIVEQRETGGFSLVPRDVQTGAPGEPVSVDLTGACELKSARAHDTSLLLPAACSDAPGEPATRGAVVHLRTEYL
jgi:hypothetical protein